MWVLFIYCFHKIVLFASFQHQKKKNDQGLSPPILIIMPPTHPYNNNRLFMAPHLVRAQSTYRHEDTLISSHTHTFSLSLTHKHTHTRTTNTIITHTHTHKKEKEKEALGCLLTDIICQQCFTNDSPVDTVAGAWAAPATAPAPPLPPTPGSSSPPSGAFPLPRRDDVLDCLEWCLLLMGVTLFLPPSEGSLLLRKSNSASSESFFFTTAPAGLLELAPGPAPAVFTALTVEDKPLAFAVGLGVEVVVGCPNLEVSERRVGTLADGERGFELGKAGWDGCPADARGESVTGFLLGVSSSMWKASAADLSSLLSKSSAFPVTADSQDMAGLLLLCYLQQPPSQAILKTLFQSVNFCNIHHRWFLKHWFTCNNNHHTLKTLIQSINFCNNHHQ